MYRVLLDKKLEKYYSVGVSRKIVETFQDHWQPGTAFPALHNLKQQLRFSALRMESEYEYKLCEYPEMD